RNRPYSIKVGEEEKHICACGLSEDKPYCDGHHKQTLDEKDGIFIYDSEGNRVKVQSMYQNP
ncbi:MAG: CDGSH iron-sulfur domain-containing protein, partial [Candidatus Thermoplasmatota archaeon]|nr:CDGSH iron-sulfur domain-containing protein [Candidatus Thermoplasmatota archaeon]